MKEELGFMCKLVVPKFKGVGLLTSKSKAICALPSESKKIKLPKAKMILTVNLKLAVVEKFDF